ncbi:DUF4342 domain-containing protein [Hoeflea sp.]|uniref:DUF4342 domain-containing protein n=1 Tax=Hoeflea sp. TaxID=1940281 RepID=UPI00198F5FEB|nr:DUF4342 domain-containing protein [Hoeflea sp.]MBC7282541.1 DUF4342 domain-containing protein [Hoeflea sp.]
MDDQNGRARKTFTEEIEVMGNQLVQQVKDLFKEGNVRQVRLKASDGDILFETPLTFGVVAGGAVALAAPWLAILGAIAAFVTHVRLEIVREVDEADSAPPESPAPESETGPEPVSGKPATTSKSAARPKAAAGPKAGAKSRASGKNAGGKAKTGSKTGA